MRQVVLIADDHPIFRIGLRSILQQENRYDCVEVGDGEQAIEKILQLAPEIAILDINMPGAGGLAVLEHCAASNPDTCFVILTVFDDSRLMERAFDLGAQAYLLKEDAETELLDCLEGITQGQRYLSGSMARDSATSSDISEGQESLTPSEQRIVEYVGQFKTSREIADQLNVSVRTVQNHRNNITRKLGLQGNNALLHFAAKTFSAIDLQE
jgi:DNA-binding NarL/FixJ family response regulator